MRHLQAGSRSVLRTVAPFSETARVTGHVQGMPS